MNWVDILLIIVFLLSVWAGWRNGFILGSVYLLTWTGCFILAYIFYFHCWLNPGYQITFFIPDVDIANNAYFFCKSYGYYLEVNRLSQYSSVTEKSFFLYIHWPLVKSGKSTVWLPSSMLVSLKGVIALHVAASYTSRFVGTLRLMASIKPWSTKKSMPDQDQSSHLCRAIT